MTATRARINRLPLGFASFVDHHRIKITSGSGGSGCISFFKGQTRGPPSGGSGGKGGDVYLMASKEITTFSHLQVKFRSDNGRPGQPKTMHGANAKDLFIHVPIGTLVKQFIPSETLKNPNESVDMDPIDQNPITPEEKHHNTFQYLLQYFKFKSGYIPKQDRLDILLDRIPTPPYSSIQKNSIQVDLLEHGQTQLVARGGKGGFGNPHFVSPTVLSPSFAGLGSPGETIHLELELKTIADAGLVGLPNAGKSSLLAAISDAHPKIAPYPFTTMNPYIGTIEYSDSFTISVADIPGLIKGAHENKGLGHRFLKHIERNKMLIYVIDLSAENPWEDLETLQSELKAYLPSLIERTSLVVANKADLGKVCEENFQILKTKTSLPIIPVSAKEKKNIYALTSAIREILKGLK